MIRESAALCVAGIAVGGACAMGVDPLIVLRDQ
jgi:hypothetical protein